MSASRTDPSANAVAATPSNVTVFDPTKGIYVGTGGNLAVTMANGGLTVFLNVVGGVVYPFSVTQVRATSTTASNLILLY